MVKGFSDGKKKRNNKFKRLADFTPNESEFVERYLLHGEPNRAALEASYAPSTANAARFWIRPGNSAKPHIAAEIQRRKQAAAARLDMTAESVIAGIARIAYADPRKLVTETGRAKPVQNLDDATAMAVQGVKFDKDTGLLTEYRLAPKVPAHDMLMKHLGLYDKDNRQKTASDDMSLDQLITLLQQKYQQLEEILPLAGQIDKAKAVNQ